MGKLGSINSEDLRKFRRDIKKLNSEQKDVFYTKAANRLAAQLLTKVIKRTPVGVYPSGSGRTGGTLRRGWMATKAQKNGNVYQSTVYNPVEYASYVEYGHRTRNHKGWVAGRFMLTNSEKELSQQVPEILQKMLDSYLQGLGHGKWSAIRH